MNTKFGKRLEQIGKTLRENQLDALVLGAGLDLEYFCGIRFHISERPIIFVILPDGQPFLFHPLLEKEKVNNAQIKLNSIAYGENPEFWITEFSQISNIIHHKIERIGILPTECRYLEYAFLKSSFPAAEFFDASSVVTSLKQIKDSFEIASIKNAISIAETSLLSILPLVKPGITEKEIAAELTIHLLKEGSDPDLPFFPIVASGPNSANPHAVPSERRLMNGDLLIIDWGARFEGYISDITRTFALASIPVEFQKIGSIVMKANEQARKFVKQGVTAQFIDRKAREIIENNGYGDYFTHRTGHGIGIKAHEDPYINGSNTEKLLEGMTFTIEPGIYLPGKGGIRIEDNVLVTKSGAQTLTSLPRQIKIL